MVKDARPIPNPLFDDEDLPAWLKDAGITFRGRVEAHDTGTLVDFAKPPWEAGTADDLPDASPTALPAWMRRTDSNDSPEVEVPAWMKVGTGELRQRQQPEQPEQTEQTEPPRPAMAQPTPKKEPPPPALPSRKDPRSTLTDSDDDLRGYYGGISDEEPEPALLAQFAPEEVSPAAEESPRLDFIDALPDYDATEETAAPADLPDWMRDNTLNIEYRTDADSDLLSALSMAAGPPSAKISRTITDLENPEVPDWMRDLPPPEEPGPGLKATEGEMDWLNQLEDAPATEPPAPSLANMANIAAAAKAAAKETPAPSQPDSQQLPEWLRNLDPTATASDSEPATRAAPAAQPTPVKAPTPAQPTASAAPTAFPATGISPEKINPPPKEEALSSIDIDALLSLAPVSVEPSGRAPESAVPPAERTLDMPWDVRDSGSLIVPGSLSTDLPALAVQPPPPSSSGAALPPVSEGPDLNALNEVSFEDTTLDEMLGPPSAAIRVGPDAYTLPPEEIPPAPESTSIGPSMLGRSSGLRKLPKRSEDEVPLPDAAAITGDLPEFVQELRPADAPVELNIGGIQVPVREEPLSKLSDSLRQLRDRARETLPEAAAPVTPQKEAEAAAAAPADGALAEIAGVLAPVPLRIEAPLQTPSQAIASDMQMKRVRLLQSLLEIDEATSPASAQVRKSARRRLGLDRMFIAVLLFAVIALPFFSGAFNLMSAPDSSAVTAAQKAALSALDGIGRGQPVLMAFEYGPSGAGELDDLARVLLRDLFARGARPIIVSTNPIGALHAESLLTVFGQNDAELRRLNRNGNPLTARRDYVLLRYLPAGAAGVRSLVNAIYTGGFEADTQFLSTDLEGKPTGLTPPDVAAVRAAPVIVLGESAEDIRNWAEQYRPPGPQKVLFAVSVAADAAARAYAASSPSLIAGPLVGLRDAILLPALRGQSVAPYDAALGAQRWQSTGLGALVAGVIILIGGTASIIGALRRRGRPNAEGSP